MRFKRAIDCSLLLGLAVLICCPSGISEALEGKLDEAKSEKQESTKDAVDAQTIQQFYEGKVLKGTIELSDKLPKVPKELMPGNRYPDDPLAGLKRTETWYRIPDWLGGRWKSTDDNGKPSSPEAIFHKGTLRDAEGSLWNLSSVPDYGVVKDIGYSVRRLADYSDGLIDSRGFVQARIHYISSGVDAHGIIYTTRQEEALATYMPKSEGVVEVIHTGKQFDLSGHYMHDIKSRAIYSRIQPFPFEAKPNLAAQNSFKNYLKSIGLERLIPSGL